MQVEPMQIKSYFADTVEQAIQAARQALGPDAVLITSRRTAPETASRGAYEVVFGVTPREAAADVEPPELGREVAALREQLENIKRALGQQAGAAPSRRRPEADPIRQELARAGLGDSVIENITAQLDLTAASGSGGAQEAAIESIRQRLRFAPPFKSRLESGTQTLVFIGPPGAGKTTTLAKVAMRECLGNRLSVRIISVETHRAGAQEKLRSLARIMGLGFTAANSMREFIEAIDEFRNKDVLLIDTPGFARNDFELAGDLIRFVRQMTAKEIHLALAASMNRDDLAACWQRYQAFQPDYLLFTKLDETESRGAAITAALSADKPVSYLTAGQGIPEDLEPGNLAALAGELFRAEKAAARSAA